VETGHKDPAQPKLASHGPPLDAQVMQREKPSREGFSALCQNGFPRPTIVVYDGWRIMHSVTTEVKVGVITFQRMRACAAQPAQDSLSGAGDPRTRQFGKLMVLCARNATLRC
jgi:hypothetical protein